MTAETIQDMVIEATAQDGSVSEVPLGDIATIGETESPSSIYRENQERYMTVSADVDDSHNVSLVSNDVQEVIDDYGNCPTALLWKFKGKRYRWRCCGRFNQSHFTGVGINIFDYGCAIPVVAVALYCDVYDSSGIYWRLPCFADFRLRCQCHRPFWASWF